jgi:hypothetical protein
MAEVDTNQLAQDHAHIRREGAEHASEIRYDIATRAGDIRQEVASAACDLSKEVGTGFGETRYNLAERAGDIRHEIASTRHSLADAVRVEGGNTRAQSGVQAGNIITEGLKGDFNTVNAVKDSRFEVITRMSEAAGLLNKTITDASGDVADRVENNADRAERSIASLSTSVGDRFYGVGRDLADLRQGQATLSKDIELNALRTQLDGKANTQYLTDKIVGEGEKTRALMNDMKYHDLNRALVERQTSLVNCEQDNRHWSHRYDDSRWNQSQAQFGAQFAQLQSMMQNFNSQLNETRQGMVNFGTMAGVGQSSTNNNVR